MNEHQSALLEWVKLHKKHLIIAGVSIAALIAIIVGLKAKDDLANLSNTLEKSLEKTPDNLPEPLPNVQPLCLVRPYTCPQEPFPVSQHIRTLSDGKHHSAAKAAEAAALGITLLPNQTLVNPYTKYVA